MWNSQFPELPFPRVRASHEQREPWTRPRVPRAPRSLVAAAQRRGCRPGARSEPGRPRRSYDQLLYLLPTDEEEGGGWNKLLQEEERRGWSSATGRQQCSRKHGAGEGRAMCHCKVCVYKQLNSLS
ncbi:hypothetical protein chiPu_0003665 [Chiloscyllium punctatum]|uniref:Uncharacterized protein n=1 Tax=Chiloscyllium punctatum TaxID=137246 RepID=A0A401S4D1_CHIPU|nr:hypothetical protein [Chiloscyllium punctatum]